MEVVITGEGVDFYPVDLTSPPQEVVVGGLRVYELMGLLLCSKGERARLYNLTDPQYVEVRSPSALEKLLCRIEVKYVAEPPPDVPTVGAGDVIRMFLGGSSSGGEPFSLVDVVRLNVKTMEKIVKLVREIAGDNVLGGRVRSDVPDDVLVIGGTVREYVVFEGPAVVGPQSEVLPFTYARRGTALYFDCKVRDEVKNSILDFRSRKVHGGYLGDSYVGKFVNFGAGSNVSNLKNTYGDVKVKIRGRLVSAGTKMGVLVGDFVKTAINTSIYCGRVIGPFSHLYGTVAEDVPPFTIYAKSLGVDPVELDLEKAIDLYKRESGEELIPGYDRVIKVAYERSKEVRKSAGVSRGRFKLLG